MSERELEARLLAIRAAEVMRDFAVMSVVATIQLYDEDDAAPNAHAVLARVREQLRRLDPAAMVTRALEESEQEEATCP